MKLQPRLDPCTACSQDLLERVEAWPENCFTFCSFLFTMDKAPNVSCLQIIRIIRCYKLELIAHHHWAVYIYKLVLSVYVNISTYGEQFQNITHKEQIHMAILDVWMGVLLDERCMEGCMNGWMDGRMDGWMMMDGWMDG